jgi:hypothetical protein
LVIFFSNDRNLETEILVFSCCSSDVLDELCFNTSISFI